MEGEEPIMTEEEIREYFKQKGLRVESVEFNMYAHIAFPFAAVATFYHLQEAAQDMGDPNPSIAGRIDGEGFKLIIDIKNNPFKK